MDELDTVSKDLFNDVSQAIVSLCKTKIQGSGNHPPW